jgi:hypothetical protein
MARARTEILSRSASGRARSQRRQRDGFDPQGRTTRMLNALWLQHTPVEWRATTQLLVVGREALSSGSKLPATWRPLRVTAVEYS